MKESAELSVKTEPYLEGQALPRERELRFTYGALATLLSQVINTVSQIALVPIFLTYWGNQLYGEWLTLSAAVAYMSTLDLGMQMYVVNRLNQYYATGKIEAYKRVLHSAFFLCLMISSALVILSVIVLIITPLDKLFHFALTNHNIASLAAILLALQIIVTIPQGLIIGIYRTVGEYPRGVMVSNVQSLFSLALTVFILVVRGGLVAVAGIQLLSLIGGVLYIWWDLKRRHPQISLGVEKRDLKLALSFLGPSSLFFLIEIAIGLTLQGSTLIASAVFGAGSVAIFVTLRTLANLIRQVTGSLNSTLWPELTTLEAQGRYQALREAQLLAVKVALIVSICIAVFLHFMGGEVVMLWTNGRIIYNARLMDVFLLLQVYQTLWMTTSVLLAASNNHRLLSVCYITSALAGLGLGYFLSQRFGLIGIVYGLLIADFVTCGWLIPWQTCRMIKQSIRRYLTEVVLRGVPVFLVLYLVSYRIFKILPPSSGVVGLTIFGLAVGVTGLILGYTLWCNRYERNRVNRFVRELLLR